MTQLGSVVFGCFSWHRFVSAEHLASPFFLRPCSGEGNVRKATTIVIVSVCFGSVAINKNNIKLGKQLNN